MKNKLAPFFATLPLLLAVGFLLVLLYIFSFSGRSMTRCAEVAPAKARPANQSVAPDLRNDTLAKIQKMARPVPVAVNPEATRIFSTWRKDAPQISISDVKKWISAPVGSSHKLRFGAVEFAANLDSLLNKDGVIAFGFDFAEPTGRFQGTFLPSGKLRAELFIEGQAIAFAVNSQPVDDRWVLTETEVSALLCVPPGTVYTKAGKADPIPPQPANGDLLLSAPPILNSLPSATYVLYCDFDGETVTHPKWNDGATINAAPHPNADNATFVSNVWKRVSEDFAPFAINVTTSRAVFDATPTARRVHCVITPTDTATPDSGGVAYLNSFGDGTPCWTFNQDEFSCADTTSHEVGHTLGLHHDGRTINGDAYYGGHGSGALSWAPIMGAPWSDEGGTTLQENVTQWSRGEYASANNTEDDLTIIAGASNGFGYRVDDIGSTQATAPALKFTGSAVSDAGVIERNTDSDWFSFTTSGGSVALNVNTVNINSAQTPQPGANLAVSLQLFNSAGSVLQTVNPTTTLSASILTNLPAGSYFLKISGAAHGTSSTGFTTYASLGQYTVTGTVPRTGVANLAVTPTTRTAPSGGGAFDFAVNSDTTWTWGKDSAWVTSSEANPQSGIQTFSYTVSPNPGATPRTATFTLTAGGLSATHQIEQQGAIIDDHGGSTAAATLVAATSSTAGNIEIAGDEDFFRIVIASAGTLVVETSGSTDTYGFLLASDGSQLNVNDDDGVGSNFRISRAVTAGTYYVRARHYNASSVGSYTLVAAFTGSSQLSISPTTSSVAAAGGDFFFNVTSNAPWTWSDNANWIESSEVTSQNGGQLFEFTVIPNTSATSRTGTITLVTGSFTATHTVTQAGVSGDDHGNTRTAATVILQNSTTGGNLETGGDLDYFRINVTSSGTLTLATTGTTDTYGTLFDSAGNDLASNDDTTGGNFRINQTVTTGTYYVQVRGYSSATGAYSLISSIDSALDDHGNAIATATVISEYSATTGNIESAGDNDYFRINLTIPGVLTVYSTGSTDTLGHLLDSAGVELEYDDDTDIDTNFRIARTMAAGTYYVGVRAYLTTTGSYAMVSEFVPNDDHGNTTGTATVISENSTTSGNLASAGDSDYFRINVTRAGTLTVSTKGSTDTFGNLRSSAGTLLSSNNDTDMLNFQISYPVTVGTYYVEVTHFSTTGTGTYQLVTSLPGSPRQLYDQAASTAGLSGVDAQANATPRGDGVKNILKYAFNMNLASSDFRTVLPSTGTAGLPSVALEGTGPTRTLKVEYLRRKNSGLLYQPKWSSVLNLGGWVQMTGNTYVVDIDTAWERVIVRQDFDTSITAKAFATVEVVLP